jgi:hypothetical protein
MRDEARVSETKSRMYRDRSGLLVNPKVRQAIQGWLGVSDDAIEIGSALFTWAGSEDGDRGRCATDGFDKKRRRRGVLMREGVGDVDGQVRRQQDQD